jgi:hypothetical protein
MKKIGFILIAVCTLGYCNAQEIARSTIGSAGGTATIGNEDNARIVQQSVGQSSVIGSFKNGSTQIRQGFIQPPITVSSIQVDETTLDAAIFPNPVESMLNIVLNEPVEVPISFVIYDMLGRVVYDKEGPAQQQMSLDMTSLSSAQYILLITAGKKQFKANRIKR